MARRSPIGWIILAGAAFGVLGWLFVSWLLMLFIGIAHDEWWRAMPPMPWHAAEPLGLILALLIGSIGGMTSRQ